MIRVAGGRVVMLVSFITVTRIQFQAPCGYLAKITLVACEYNLVQFDPTEDCRFSPGTPVSSCSNTGPMRVGPY